ncbi:MAG: rRNA synthase [Frankiaceae bacterium]|jgi:23S rRNA pseudouridine2605 synthase|nr:rRNA synthase [Frankiaceae bacterium]
MHLMAESPPEVKKERLQKVMAAAGVGSRRHCEELIAEGRVMVDGERVDRMGMTVDPADVVIHVDGTRLVTTPGLVHLVLNKPRGMVTTMSDPEGRPCIGDLVADRAVRLFHVGRLDTDTEGLLLLTNDGELGHRLTHPSYGITKTYLAEVAGPVPRDLGRRLRDGIELDDGVVRVDDFKVKDVNGPRVLVELVIHEGRNHVVRRLLEAAGNPVHALVRTELGPIQLGSLKPGRTRHLTSHEVGALYRAVGM